MPQGTNAAIQLAEGHTRSHGTRRSDINCGSGLGSQTLAGPVIAIPDIPKPVMQPTRPPMPELNLLGNDTVTPPGLRHGDALTVRILLSQRSHIRFQLLPAGGPALMRDGGAELAAPGA